MLSIPATLGHNHTANIFSFYIHSKETFSRCGLGFVIFVFTAVRLQSHTGDNLKWGLSSWTAHFWLHPLSHGWGVCRRESEKWDSCQSPYLLSCLPLTALSNFLSSLLLPPHPLPKRYILKACFSFLLHPLHLFFMYFSWPCGDISTCLNHRV